MQQEIINKTRKAAVKTYIWSILLYGAESWTLSKKMEEKLQAMEMWMMDDENFMYRKKIKRRSFKNDRREERTSKNYQKTTNEIYRPCNEKRWYRKSGTNGNDRRKKNQRKAKTEMER